MSIHAKGSFTGNYEPRGDTAEADCVIGHEFAAPLTGFGSVNESLAKFVFDNYCHMGIDLLLNKNIAGALHLKDPYMVVAHQLMGESSTITGKNTGTWGELEQAADYMHEHNLRRPILVAQAFHVGRVALQAEKLGLNPIIPESLPRHFDRRSTQIWTRNRALWAAREFPGAYMLRRRGQL